MPQQDEEHLRLLSVFHYVVAALAGMFALFPIIHLVLGLVFILAPDQLGGKGEPPPPFIGWIFVIVASLLIVLGLVFAALVFTAGRFLGKRTHYTFCVAIAAVECLFMPFGTILGVFTIIVLMRDTVKALFAAKGP